MVYCQIILGATMRHIEAGMAIPDFPLAFGHLVPPFWNAGVGVHFAHRVGAVLVTTAILATAGHVWFHHRTRRELVRPATLLALFVLMQICLGAFVIWSGLQPIINTAHVVNGALVLATSLVLTLRTFRYRFADMPLTTARRRARRSAGRADEIAPAGSTQQHMKSTASAIPTAPSRTADLVALAKPRLNMLVVVSAVAGYVMASGDTRDVWRLLCMIVGTALVAGGASAFNQIIERKPDALDAAHAPPADAGRPRPDARGLGVRQRCSRSPGWRSWRSAPTCSAPSSPSLTRRLVRRRLHAAQALLVVLDRHRRDSRRAAAGHRLGRGARRALAGRLGPLRHRLSVAAAALPRHRLDLP